jgi:acyl-coenzyme A synthetase/AMP-(fatty) acid ligase
MLVWYNQLMNRMLWQPTESFRSQSAMQHYMAWLAHTHGQTCTSYNQLWQWSVDQIEPFWASQWEYFAIQASKPYDTVLAARQMPGATWFAGAELSYAEHIFRDANNQHPAILFQGERAQQHEISWQELRSATAHIAAGLRRMGVTRGDRVVAYLPNIPEAVIAFLACASIGAIWSSCSPDMGEASVLDRFRQIAPKVLFAVDGYWYGGKRFERHATIAALQAGLPSLEYTVVVEYLDMASATSEYHAPLPEGLLRRCRELRQSSTNAEKAIWQLLRNRQINNAKFRRQHPKCGYILDFYCHEVKLAIELDGAPHAQAGQRRYDEQRTKALEAAGIQVVRFWNNEALNDTERILSIIWELIEAQRRATHPASSLTLSLAQIEAQRRATHPASSLTLSLAQRERELPTSESLGSNTSAIPPSPFGRGAGGEGKPGATGEGTTTLTWNNLFEQPAPDLTFEQLPFDHPLWILYSSGTTGLPKPIVHSQGGILLEHLKSLRLHLDLGPGDRFFWFTTTGWMMWNFLVGGLLVGATILLYDGSPATPDLGALWRFAEQSQMTFFGTSAAYLATCQKNGIEPAQIANLHALRGLGSTGSPLPNEGFDWVYQHVKHDIWLASISGGTDVCTAFVGGCPLLPVYAGEIQCRCLGVRAEAFDDHGQSVINQVGELVITKPIPSMPISFWNDPGGKRLRESYFEHYPGIWRHGDWVQITPHGSLIISGRSDSTINRAGIRMGTSEIYRAVEGIAEILDSLVIDLEGLGGSSFMPLFVVLREGMTLDEALSQRIKQQIRTTLSARHVPDEIYAIPEIPRTLNGKKLEVPIKKILRGIPIEQAANPDAMANPASLQWFVAFAAARGFAGKS